jgi:hypothetical protein
VPGRASPPEPGPALAVKLDSPLTERTTVMPIFRRPLDATFANVVLDGAGNGTASIGPQTVRERWYPTNVGVTVSSDNSEPACKIFSGPAVSPIYYVDGTGTGSFDSTDSIAGKELHAGDKVWAVWTGGDPGAIATVTVTGEYQIGHN